MSKALEEARAILPPRLHGQLDVMVEEYKFACLKHHGFQMVSPKVIAELILNKWSSAPFFGTSMFTGAANAYMGAARPPIPSESVTMCTCGLHRGEEQFCPRNPCGLKP